MTRLIDADALWEQMKELHEKRSEEANMTGDRVVCVTWHDAVIFIKNAPTVDAVEVVRCKDCMYMTEDRYTDGNVPCYICSEWDKGTEYGGFCHLGERKETKNE